MQTKSSIKCLCLTLRNRLYVKLHTQDVLTGWCKCWRTPSSSAAITPGTRCSVWKAMGFGPARHLVLCSLYFPGVALHFWVILILLTSITMRAGGGTSRHRWPEFKEGTVNYHRQPSSPLIELTCLLVVYASQIPSFSLSIFNYSQANCG